MEARKIDASNDKLTSEVLGEVEVEDKVLVIKRIHVTYKLQADAAHRETIERVHGIHADYCPVYKSISAAIDITTSLNIED